MKKMYILLWLLLLCEQLLAQNKGMVPVGKQLPAGTERRLALVIGNKNYVYAGRLNNTHNDADDMARVLQNLGFDVILKKDLSMVDFLKAIDDFGTKLGQYNVGLLYYSGHGIQYQGENYLVPIDAKANAAEDIEYTCVKLGRAMAKMEGAKLKVSLAFLDACRNNPFPSSSRAVGQGLTIPNNPPGSFVAFSTRAGSTADDNSSGRNGLFTSALLQNLPQANIGLRTMMDKVTETVIQSSNNNQKPGRYDELWGDFYFLMSKYPEPAKPEKDLFPYEPQTVFVQGGSFRMGTAADNTAHTVTLANYAIGMYEVTQKQWKAVVGSIPAGIAPCENCPIGGVNWNDTQLYLQKLNELTGKNYRLPTEAEWEYAAGGGQKSNGFIHAGSNTVESVGWIDLNSGNKIHEVGGKQPNELGLYDMNGNVWEWCSDWYGPYNKGASNNPTGPSSGTSRVLRGGSYVNNFQLGRVASRGSNNPNERYINFGLRVVLVP